MRDELAIWIVASATAISTIGSSVVEVLLAFEVHELHLKVLLFVAFGLQIVALGCVAYLCFIFIRRRRSFSKQIAWLEPSAGAGFNAVALAAAGVALIWLVIKQNDLPKRQGLRTSGLVVWAVVVVLHGTFFMLLAIHTRKVLVKSTPPMQAKTFGITSPPVQDLAYGTRVSFCSRDTTLASRPVTPRARSRKNSLQSSATKAASSVRSKMARTSARSSVDLPAFPAGEATALGSAFDRYDASNVDMETRNTVLLSSSPTVIRFDPGLEPIPGSRPGSPDDGPPLPSSTAPPTLRQRALGSPIRVKKRQNASDSPPSSPPSSPPNFSRPTTATYPPTRAEATPRPHQPTMSEQLFHPQFSTSMTELIHPLFRSDSPNPPQIMTSGTMVTASPLADTAITPKTLSRLRSASDLEMKNYRNTSGATIAVSSTGTWRLMPLVEAPTRAPSRQRAKSSSSLGRTTTAGSDGAASMKSSRAGMGSPGPSISEEDEMPPILPSFVLSAGSRSSLVDFQRRKSLKTDSAHRD